MYSAPSGDGVLYWTHSPLRVMTAWPVRTSMAPALCFTCSAPFNTYVYSSNCGVCPGSTQPDGLRMCATLTTSVFEFTRPMTSSMSFGLLPAAVIRVGFSMSVGMAAFYNIPITPPPLVHAMSPVDRLPQATPPHDHAGTPTPRLQIP